MPRPPRATRQTPGRRLRCGQDGCKHVWYVGSEICQCGAEPLPPESDDDDLPEPPEFTPPVISDAGDPYFDPPGYRIVERRDGRYVSSPFRTSHLYRAHCRRRLRMSADDVKTELGRALSRTARTQLASTVDAVRAAEQGELEPDVDFFVAMTVRWDVHWHPVHWLNFKTDSAKRRDRDALKLIEQVEQRFRPYAVGRGGRRVGSKNRPRDRPPEELRMQQLAPELRGLIKHAKRLCREGRNPSPALGRIADLLTPSPSAKDIETFSVEVGPPRRLRKSPEEIVRWVVAKHLGIGLSAAKNLIKRPR